MKQGNKLVFWILIFAVVLAAAFWAYRHLSENYTPGQEQQPSVEISSQITPSQEEASEENVVPAPDFTVLDMEGNTVKLSDHFGKPIILNFWATWCGPCQVELPAFDRVYAKYGDQVTFMMIDLTDGSRETKETVEQFIAENDYRFPVYLDTEYEAALSYGAYSIPLTVIIDSEGNIVSRQIGVMSEQALEAAIAQLIG